MSEPIQPLLALVKAHGPAVLAWMGGLRLLIKPVSARIQANLTARMVETAESPDPEDDKDLDGLVLTARWYRVLNFTLDLIFSFKLPTHADFLRLKTKQQTNNSINP